MIVGALWMGLALAEGETTERLRALMQETASTVAPQVVEVVGRPLLEYPPVRVLDGMDALQLVIDTALRDHPAAANGTLPFDPRSIARQLGSSVARYIPELRSIIVIEDNFMRPFNSFELNGSHARELARCSLAPAMAQALLHQHVEPPATHSAAEQEVYDRVVAGFGYWVQRQVCTADPVKSVIARLEGREAPMSAAPQSPAIQRFVYGERWVRHAVQLGGVDAALSLVASPPTPGVYQSAQQGGVGSAWRDPDVALRLTGELLRAAVGRTEAHVTDGFSILFELQEPAVMGGRSVATDAGMLVRLQSQVDGEGGAAMLVLSFEDPAQAAGWIEARTEELGRRRGRYGLLLPGGRGTSDPTVSTLKGLTPAKGYEATLWMRIQAGDGYTEAWAASGARLIGIASLGGSVARNDLEAMIERALGSFIAIPPPTIRADADWKPGPTPTSPALGYAVGRTAGWESKGLGDACADELLALVPGRPAADLPILLDRAYVCAVAAGDLARADRVLAAGLALADASAPARVAHARLREAAGRHDAAVVVAGLAPNAYGLHDAARVDLLRWKAK